METLVVVDQHRGRYQGKNRGNGPSPSRVFREINCRTFQSGVGILPTPVKAWKPVGKQAGGSPSVGNFVKTPSRDCVRSVVGGKHKSAGSFMQTPSPNCGKSVVEGKNSSRKSRSGLKKSSSVPTPFNVKVNSDEERFLYCKKLSYSELWAGPAYSNSPPPSSLPIPKFSVPPKRTGSLELPSPEPEVHLHQVSRSAPPSPKRDHANSGRNVFHSADYASATKDLRRILNLDMDDE
ncbi:hypothetical protein ACET3Z_019268 [Daucus carota]